MLVLSRKVGEVINIGSSVTVTVLSVDRGIIRLGIDAPKSIPVHRKEIHDKIVEINKQAARTEISALKKAITKSKIFNKIEKQDSLTNKLINFSEAKSDK